MNQQKAACTLVSLAADVLRAMTMDRFDCEITNETYDIPSEYGDGTIEPTGWVDIQISIRMRRPKE